MKTKCNQLCLAPTHTLRHDAGVKDISELTCEKCENHADVAVYKMSEYIRKEKGLTCIMTLCDPCCEKTVERCRNHDMDMMEIYNYFHWR